MKCSHKIGQIIVKKLEEKRTKTVKFYFTFEPPCDITQIHTVYLTTGGRYVLSKCTILPVLKIEGNDLLGTAENLVVQIKMKYKRKR